MNIMEKRYFVISTIIGTLGDNLILLAFYCLGYAVGLFLGSTLEGKNALGTSSLQLIANDENTEKIITHLKEGLRGYTAFEGQGSKDKMNMIFIVLPRRDTAAVAKQKKSYVKTTFVVVMM